MTKRELIEALEALDIPDDADVLLECPPAGPGDMPDILGVGVDYESDGVVIGVVTAYELSEHV